eukprot:scaffold1394_cov109-Isochrysis_galbana.AAC.14
MASLPESSGTEVRAGKVTRMSRVSPFFTPISPSTRPGMNLPGLSGSCTLSPPATAGSSSPFPPSGLAAYPIMSTRSWLPDSAAAPSSASCRSAYWSRSFRMAASYAS